MESLAAEDRQADALIRVKLKQEDFSQEQITVKNNKRIVWMLGAVLIAGMIAGLSRAASGQKADSSPSAGKQWLSAMDPDNDGTVDKQEFTAYMPAQFQKADTDNDGTLAAKELTQLQKNFKASAK